MALECQNIHTRIARGINSGSSGQPTSDIPKLPKKACVRPTPRIYYRLYMPYALVGAESYWGGYGRIG